MATTGGYVPKPPELVRVFKGHTGPVSGACFHPFMHQMLSGSHDGKLYVWHFKQQLRPFKFEGHKGEVTDLTVSKDGSFFASSSSDKTVNIWMNNSKGAPSHTIKAHTAAVRSCDFSHDNSLLATASDDKIVKIWQITPSSSKFLTSLEGHTHWVRSARFSQTDSNLITTCGDDKSVRVWDLRVGAHSAGGSKTDRACVMKMAEHIERVNRSIFHPDATCIASCSDDRTVKIWDLRRKRLIQHYDAHTGCVMDIDFCCSSTNLTGQQQKNYLASCSVDRSVKLWDLQEGRLLYTMAGHEDTVSSIKFSPQGQFLVSGGHDNKLFVWKSGLFPDTITGSASTGVSTADARPGTPSNGKPFIEKLFDVPMCANPILGRQYLYNAPKSVNTIAPNTTINNASFLQKGRGSTSIAHATKPKAPKPTMGKQKLTTVPNPKPVSKPALNSSLGSLDGSMIETKFADYVNSDVVCTSPAKSAKGKAKRKFTPESRVAANNTVGNNTKVGSSVDRVADRAMDRSAERIAAERPAVATAVAERTAAAERTPSQDMKLADATRCAAERADARDLSPDRTAACKPTSPGGKTGKQSISTSPIKQGLLQVESDTQTSVAQALTQMTMQMELLMKTVSSLDQRMLATEQKLEKLVSEKKTEQATE